MDARSNPEKHKRQLTDDSTHTGRKKRKVGNQDSTSKGTLPKPSKKKSVNRESDGCKERGNFLVHAIDLNSTPQQVQRPYSKVKIKFQKGTVRR